MREFINIVTEGSSFSIEIDDLVLDIRSVRIVFNDILKNKLSHTKGPISTVSDSDGLRLVDGYHRTLQAILLGKKSIRAKIDPRFSSDMHIPHDKRWTMSMGFELLGYSLEQVVQAIDNCKNILTESYGREMSPELFAWVKRWVESSYQIQDQIEKFQPLMEEAERFLNVGYPAIYRGLSVTDDQADTLASGHPITIPAHKLQSWTKSRSIAEDYALPGFGGDVGLLIRKTGNQVAVRADIANMVRAMGSRAARKAFGGDIGVDAAREKEVVVETNGTLLINPKDVLKIF